MWLSARVAAIFRPLPPAGRTLAAMAVLSLPAALIAARKLRG